MSLDDLLSGAGLFGIAEIKAWSTFDSLDWTRLSRYRVAINPLHHFTASQKPRCLEFLRRELLLLSTRLSLSSKTVTDIQTGISSWVLDIPDEWKDILLVPLPSTTPTSASTAAVVSDLLKAFKRPLLVVLQRPLLRPLRCLVCR